MYGDLCATWGKKGDGPSFGKNLAIIFCLVHLIFCLYSTFIYFFRHTFYDGVPHLGVPQLPTRSVRLSQGRVFPLTLACCAAHFLPELNLSLSIPHSVPHVTAIETLQFGVFFLASTKSCRDIGGLFENTILSKGPIDVQQLGPYIFPYKLVLHGHLKG